MKSFIVLVVLVAAALAAPSALTPDGEAQILRYDSQRDENDKGYSYAVETSNGIQTQEEGELVLLDPENPFMIVRGSFAYLAPNGVVYTVTYTADQDGFHPEGVHLPVA